VATCTPNHVGNLLSASFLTIGLSVSLQAGDHFWLDTRAEARVTFTDNAELTLSDRLPETVLNFAPGVNARWESKRVQAGVDYAWDYFYFVRDKTEDVRQNMFGSLDAEVIDDHLNIGARASLRQQFLDQRGSISNSSANRTNNRRLIQNYTGTAIAKGGLREFANWRFTYRFGLSRSPADNLEDETLPVNFSDDESHEFVASIGSGTRFNNFEWSLFADSTRVIRSLDVNDYRNEHAGAEFKIKFNRFFQLIGDIGASRNGLQSAELSEDGFSWEAGFRWTPGRKLDLTVQTGREGRRETWYGSLQYFFSPRIDFNGNYQDTITSNSIVTNDSLQDFGFNPELGISNSQGLPIDETDPIFTYSDRDYRRQNAQGNLTIRQKRSELYIGGNMEWRTFDDDSGTASSWGANAGFTREITERQTISGGISYRQSRFEGETRIDNYIEANLDWSATISRYFKAAIGYSHSERQSNEPGADLEENALTFYLRGTF
jgi:hypothetical protein